MKAHIRIGNRISEMANVVSFVNDFGAAHGVPENELNELNLSLDEILNNTISYGYSDRKRHEIQVSLVLEQDALIAEIEDDGAPFNPLEAPPPDVSGTLQTRKVGGVGIHFARTLMDGMEYTRAGQVNRLRLRKRITRVTKDQKGET
jgi:anti-sigma regulatory factor (Ser/Thr protein kinase)